MKTTGHTRQARHDSKATILVVDDELGPRESLRLILTPAYNVTLANDGLEGFERFRAEDPDMIISDIRMPRLNGIELMKRVKASSPDTPFVLLTGFGTLESAQEAVRSGAFDYISKPYNVEEIRAVVSRALDMRRERHAMEAQLARLHETNEQLEHAIESMDQKASMGDLSAEMIHDLNNPICALQGYVEFLEDALAQRTELDTSQERELLDVIKQQADRCIHLTRRFIDFSKPAHLDWKRQSVNQCIEDTVYVFRPRLRALGIEAKLDLQPNLPELWLDSKRLQQVFYNLIANAIHAMEEVPRPRCLTMTTAIVPATTGAPADGRSEVRVAISDTGNGIPEELRERVFVRFFTTKPQGKGTGLGLSICKRISEEHGGTIRLAATGPQGTTFEVILPELPDCPPA